MPKPSDTVFIKLPTSQQIDDLILSVDSLGFTKVIQDVNKSSGYSCEQKVNYLNNMLGRVQSAISMKTFVADQLQSVINTATDQFNSITLQISQKQDQLKTLNITSIKEKLQIDLTTLEGLYAKFNSIDTNTGPLEATIDGYKKDIATLRAKSDIDRQ